jgi:hypothetical protein
MLDRWNAIDGRIRAALLILLGLVVTVGAAAVSSSPTETGGTVLALYVGALAVYSGWKKAQGA